VNQPTPPIADAAPVPFLEGTFAIYETPDGGYHIAYKTKGSDDTQHMEIPGAALKMAKAMSGVSNPFAMFGAMKKGMSKNGNPG
jgi:hypothetical protein